MGPAKQGCGLTGQYWDQSSITQVVREALQQLNDRDRAVLMQRSGIGTPKQTLEEIGAALGLSKQRIGQIEQRAMLRLRQVLDTKGVTC